MVQCKEHQRAHWRLHRSICKNAQTTDDYFTQQRRLVEDWVETHRYEMIAMITWYIRRNAFDRRHEAFFVVLDVTNDGSGTENPATAFQVKGAPYVQKMDRMPEVDEVEAQDKAERPTDKIIGYFYCCCEYYPFKSRVFDKVNPLHTYSLHYQGRANSTYLHFHPTYPSR